MTKKKLLTETEEITTTNKKESKDKSKKDNKFDATAIKYIGKERVIQLDQNNKLEIRLLNYKSYTYLEISKFYKRNDEWTKGKGIWLPADIAEELATNIKALAKKLN